MNINIKKLASYLVDEELENRIEKGKYAFVDIWDERTEECHGLHKFYDMSKNGTAIHDDLTTHYLMLIQEFEI